MVLKVIALCLSSFAVGWSCCSIVYQIALLREARQRQREAGHCNGIARQSIAGQGMAQQRQSGA